MQADRNHEFDELSIALDSTFSSVVDADRRTSNSDDLRKQALSDRGASPSSVLHVPIDGNTQTRPFAEPTFTVVFGDEGAEVTVDVIPLQNEVPDIPASTPSRNLRELSGSSLLDEEGTQANSPKQFSRSPISPASTNVCLSSNFCCAGVNFGREDAGSVDIVKLEARITKFLSDPMQIDGLCVDWQSWSYQMTLLLPGHSSANTAVKDVRQVLRNRAFDMSARRHRMRTLRRDISPFNTSPSPKKFTTRLKKTKSFDIELHAPAVERVSKDAGNLWKLASVWESVQICTLSQPPVDSPAVIRARVRDAIVHEDTCYDSDPEDFIGRSSNRRAKAFSIVETPEKPTLKARHSFGPVRDIFRKDSCEALPSPPSSNLLYFHDDDNMRLSLQEFMNERFTLIFHKKSATQNAFTPHAVSAWIERGQHLNCYIIQPKFVWQSIREKKGRRGFSVPESEITSFDLIDVSRVLEIDRVDRELYPFAKSTNCFVIKTMEQTFLFEAETAGERLRLVNMLKMMVARLGSKLIVGDTSFVDEFFIMSVDQGPGNVPYWANM